MGKSAQDYAQLLEDNGFRVNELDKLYFEGMDKIAPYCNKKPWLKLTRFFSAILLTLGLSDMAEYEKGSHTIYDIKYHMVWVTKYRYQVLKDEVALRLRLIDRLAEAGVLQLSIGGGEPFLRADLVQLAARAKSGNMVVHVTTGRYHVETAVLKAMSSI